MEIFLEGARIVLSYKPNAELLFRSFNAVFASVFAQQAQYDILICQLSSTKIQIRQREQHVQVVRIFR